MLPCSMTGWLTNKESSTRMQECSKRLDMHACTDASYVVLELGMDVCTLYTGVGSTLWAWYACIVEPGTPVCTYVCYRHALLVCASSARRLPVAGARLSARCAAGCPLPRPVSSRCSCSTVYPLRCSLLVPVSVRPLQLT